MCERGKTLKIPSRLCISSVQGISIIVAKIGRNYPRIPTTPTTPSRDSRMRDLTAR